MTDALPIDAVLPELLQRLRAENRLILQADPGAGKTTRVPLAILSEGLIKDGQKILMLEPRRVAARAAASFMAATLNEAVGETVGYRVRFESRIGPRTRIEVLTQGLLTRRIQDDPELADVDVLIFDEFHERHLATDLGLAMALDVQASLRPDLRILIMSATIDAQRIGEFLDAGVIRSEGRSHPVEMLAYPARRDESTEHQVARCVREAMAAHEGDALVFLPGIAAIRRVERLLQNEPFEVLTLHGEMAIDAQARVLRAHDPSQRRAVLATNVAESSVTLPNVRIVIDSGLANEPRYDAQTGLTSLKTVLVSQASADQRSGRAGRTVPGVAYRLWPASQRLDPQRRPEMTQTDLSNFALELAAWGDAELKFLDTPPPATLKRARQTLQSLGFLQDGKITADGRRALDLGLDVRLAKIVLTAHHQDLSAILATFESARQLRSDSDAWLRQLDNARRNPVAKQLQAQWQRRRRSQGKPEPRDIAAAVAPGYIEWIAKQSPKDPYRYHLFNGNTAQLHPQTDLFGHEFILITELSHDRPHARIRSAIPLDEGFLREHFAEHFTERDEATWDPQTETVRSARVARFGKIELHRKPIAHADKAAVTDALMEYLVQTQLQALPETPALSDFLARVRCAQSWLAQDTADWPRFDTASLTDDAQEWLLPLLTGKSSIKSLDAAHVEQAIRQRLDWSRTQQLNEWLPTRIEVPSGLERPVEYRFDENWRDADGTVTSQAHDPVFKVKLQELFGLAETPRVAKGRMPLQIHLLSPGGKPLQVTKDLRSFWDNTYPEVRKEMKGRYPKHPWPDDPWNATATHRAKPRGT